MTANQLGFGYLGYPHNCYPCWTSSCLSILLVKGRCIKSQPGFASTSTHCPSHVHKLLPSHRQSSKPGQSLIFHLPWSQADYRDKTKVDGPRILGLSEETEAVREESPNNIRMMQAGRGQHVQALQDSHWELPRATAGFVGTRLLMSTLLSTEAERCCTHTGWLKPQSSPAPAQPCLA